MAKKTTKTDKTLERQVASAYRAIGARKVEHDVELAGHQIDVYVEMETADRALHRIAVEARDHTKPVGIKIVRDFANVVNTLRALKLVDEGVIVSPSGFSRQARYAAKEHGLRVLEPADLKAMVAISQESISATARIMKTGKPLEQWVADAYRAIGARVVEHDMELAGHQIDVYVEMEAADRSLHRIAIEAKDYTKPVGLKIVRDFADVVDTLRHFGYVEEGVIVSASGFSRQARNAAKEHGLRLLEPADLEAMAGKLDLAQMRANYLSSLRQRFEYLDLGGIAPRVQDRTVKLRMGDVFVPVQARPELETRAMEADRLAEIAGMPEGAEEEVALRMLARRERASEAKLVEIPELLHRPRVVVLGDPGSGKSTLLRHIAYAVADGKAEDVGKATLERLPIFVRIVQFSQAQADNHALTLDTYIRETCAPRWAPLFQHALDSGEALVLLDGLDEVVDAHQRKSIAEAIQILVADYPGNAFLVTSRIVGYQAARLSGDFSHYTIQPLPLERITEFVTRWYETIEREGGEAELSEETRERAEELNRAIQERPGIQRLAENPLLLTIIALVNWRGRKLPNRRVEVYAHAAETLIESWPYRRRGVELDTERVIRLLSPLAYRIFDTHFSGNITEDELLPILSNTIYRLDRVERHTAKVHAAEFVDQISEQSGIFRERGYDERGRRVFGFLHLTFAEYFAARYLAKLWEEFGENAKARQALLRKYAHVPRWREVVLLIAGDVGLRDNDRAERATRLLGDILTLRSDEEDCLHRDLLLAGEVLADDLRVQPQSARYVLENLLKLVLEPDVGEAIQDIFRTMRETAYGQPMLEGLLARLEDEDWIVRGRTVEALGRIGDPRAVGDLLNQLEDRNSNVRKKAAEALGRIGDARAVDGLLARLEDENTDVRSGAYWGLRAINSKRAIDGLRAWLVTAGLSVDLVSGGVMLVGIPTELVLAVTNHSLEPIDRVDIEMVPSAEYHIESSNPIALDSLYPEEPREVSFIIHPRVSLEIPIDLRINGKLREPALRIVAMRDNPYVYGNPIDNEMFFFGRKRELNDIFQAVTKPNKQDILLVGERRSGKTSLLYQLERRLRLPYIPVYVVINEAPANVMGVIRLIVRRVTGSLVQIGILPAEPWGQYQCAYERLTESLEPVFNAVRNRRPEARIILLADEADYLLEVETRLQHVLRAALQSREVGSMLAAVFAGTSSLRQYVSQSSSPLLNQFRFVSLVPLSLSETQELITKPTEALGYNYDPLAVEDIRLASGGHPYYCQRICYEAFALALEGEGTTIDKGLAEEAINRVIESVSDDAFMGFKTYFWDPTSPEERDFMRRLAGSSKGRVKSPAPNRLLNWQVVKREGEYYEFTALLFQEWVKRLGSKV